MHTEPLPAPGDLLDEKEVAAILALAVTTLRNWRALGPGHGPRFVKLGKRAVRYRRSDLAEFIAGDAEASRA